MLALFLLRRYLVAWLLVIVVAAVCCLAGVWQWDRLQEKRTVNVELRSNSESAPISAEDLLPEAASAAAATVARDHKFRQVAATGVYEPVDEVVVRGQTVGSSAEGVGELGFLVLTPLRLDTGHRALVVRGFIKATQNAQATPTVPAPPTGRVTIVARVMPAEATRDKYGELPAQQVDSINSEDAQARSGSPVLAGYLELEAGQPGGGGLTAIPAPDLSNPAGGAIEPQHLAYVIQWFVFAVLALALPFILARADLRVGAVPPRSAGPRRLSATSDGRQQASDGGGDGHGELEDRQTMKLADRYGR